MKFFWLVVVVILLFADAALAQQSVSPSVAQRLLRIIERFSEDPQRMLEELDRLASNRGIRDADAGFVRREQAALLIREERTQEALNLLQSTLDGQPDDYVPSLRLMTGQLLLMEGDPERALEQLEIWSSQTVEPNPVELSMLGYAYLQMEQFDSAAITFERVIEVADVISDQWYEVLAYAYVQSGRSDDAITLLDHIIAEQPDQSRWWQQLSNVFLLLEDYSSGAASLVIADILDQLDHAGSRRLAGLFSMLNMPAEGAEVLAAASTSFPQEHGFEDQMLLAELWMLARETDRAIVAFEAALTMADEGEPALKIAQLHLQWERYDEAGAALRLAADLFGEETPDEIWYLLAIVEINRDDLEAASQAIARLDPEGNYAQRGANLDQFIESQRN